MKRQKLKTTHDAQLAAAATEARIDITGFKLEVLAQLELPYSTRATSNIFNNKKNAQAVNDISEQLGYNTYRKIAERGDCFFFVNDGGGFGFYGQIRHVDGRVTGALYFAVDNSDRATEENENE